MTDSNESSDESIAEQLSAKRPKGPPTTPPFEFAQCRKCLAWRDAKTEGKKCCLNGKNILSSHVLPQWDQSFLTLLLTVPRLSREARMINNSLSFVSIGTCCPESRKDDLTDKGWVRPSGIPRMYGLFGRTYHFVVQSDNACATSFYMFGCSAGDCFSPLCSDDLKIPFISIAEYLKRRNSFAGTYRAVADLPQANKHAVFRTPRSREDEPFIAQGVAGHPELAPLKSFALYPKSGTVQYYSTMHRCGEAGSYPLLFPTGMGGWYGETSGGRVCHPLYENGTEIAIVYQYMKYAWYQHIVQLTILGTASQQWTLDNFSRWQEIVFYFMAKNSKVAHSVKLRLYSMKDLNTSRVNSAGKKGRPLAIPASVPGSPAARRKSCREAFAVIAELGGAHAWVTATCNPKWPEVAAAARKMFPEDDRYHELRSLPPELLAHIVTRVYWTKYLVFLKLLRAGHFSHGRSTVWLQVVHEFQKRYWAHFHLLCRFEDYETLTERELDTMYCARLFIYEDCPMSLHTSFSIEDSTHRERLRKDRACTCRAHKLHRVVFGLMMHKCCATSSANCRFPANVRKNGTCEKRFPHDAGTAQSQVSFTDASGFYHPRRPFSEDAYVVPYNRHVFEYMMENCESGYFNFHNHWDQCAGAHTLEYVFEYQHKGPDFTEVTIEDALRDVQTEFREYQRLRHIGFVESLMRFFNMEMVRNEPATTEVSVHLEGEQFVAASEGIDDERLQELLAAKETPLLRYFWRPPDFSALRLAQYYSLYDLKASISGSKVRIKDAPPPPHKEKFVVKRTTRHICRVEYGGRYHAERYCLGLILSLFPRTSFADCRSVDGVTYQTYSQAAYALGIFSEFDEFEMCLRELINPNFDSWKNLPHGTHVPVVGQVWKARGAFLTMIMNGAASQKLFDDFAWYLSRDALTRGETTEDTSQIWLLQWIKKELLKNQLTLEDVGLHDTSPDVVNELYVRANEAARVPKTTLAHWIAKIPLLDRSQKTIFDAVAASVLDKTQQQRLFYVDARAGCGKTFLCQCLSAHIRVHGKIVLTSAPSALAASLHIAGTTCHKCFGLPVTNERKQRTSSLSTRSYQGTAVRICDLLIIDEISMFDALNFDCVDRLCRDVCNSDLPFGGKVVLCCGEFAQLPPVIPNGNRCDILTASVISHPLWPQMEKAKLHHRWRNKDDLDFQSFCDGLATPTRDGFFESPKLLPQFLRFTTNATAVECFVGTFEGFPTKLVSDEDFIQLAKSPIYVSIVAAYHHAGAKNLDTDISVRVRNRLSEPLVECRAVDTAIKGSIVTP